MNSTSARFSAPLFLLALGCLLCAGCFARPAHGQFVAAQNTFTMTQQQFDGWLTGGGGNQTVESQFTAQLTLKIAEIAPVCDLTPQQKEQLELAGKADLGRFMRRVAVVEAKLVGKTLDINEAYQQVAPFTSELRKGLCGEGSLFQKVLNHVISEEQLEIIHQAREQRWQHQYRSAVRVQIAMLQRMLAMTQKQREELELLFRPPSAPFDVQNSNLQILVYYQMSKIPEEKLEPIFDNHQVEALNRFRSRFSGYGQHLRQQGIQIDDE